MLNGLSISNLSNYANHMKFIKYSNALKITTAKDNPAGLAISEKMQAQFRGDNVATRNMQDGVSLGRTAEGALGQTQSVLQRMRELSIQSNNGLLSDSDRAHLQHEFSGLRDTIEAIGRDTQFNKKPLLDGTVKNHNVTTSGNGHSVSLNVGAVLPSHLSNTNFSLADIDLRSDPANALTVIDGVLEQISGSRGKLGAFENRLDHSISVAKTQSINMNAAESRIRDADLAKNAIELQKIQVMQQAYFKSQRMGIGMMGMNVNVLM